MRRKAPFALLVLSILVILAPMFVLNVVAPSSCCNLDAITYVPTADKVVRVQLDGWAIYNLNQTFVFATSSIHTILVLDTSFIGTSSHMKYTFKEWDYAGRQFDTNPMTTPPMYTNYTVAQCQPGPPALNCPFVATFTVAPLLGCNTTCYMDISTNVPSADGTINVKIDNSVTYSLPQVSLPFGNGTGPHTIQLLTSTTFTGTSSGARYVWKQWSCACPDIASTAGTTLTTPVIYKNYTDPARSPPLNGVGGLTAVFDKQFQLTVNFVDPSNQPVAPPTFLTIQSGNAVLNLTSYSGQWTNAVLWTVIDAKWQGMMGMVPSSPTQTIDLSTGTATATITLSAYAASIEVVDNSNNPVAGAAVTVIFANSTSKSFTTDIQGMIQLGHVPLGPYTAKVSYNGQDAGNWATNARTDPQPLVVKLPSTGGLGANSTTSSWIVLVTIFGLVFFLILLAVKLPKTPPRPTIQP